MTNENDSNKAPWSVEPDDMSIDVEIFQQPPQVPKEVIVRLRDTTDFEQTLETIKQMREVQTDKSKNTPQ